MFDNDSNLKKHKIDDHEPDTRSRIEQKLLEGRGPLCNNVKRLQTLKSVRDQYNSDKGRRVPAMKRSVFTWIFRCLYPHRWHDSKGNLVASTEIIQEAEKQFERVSPVEPSLVVFLLLTHCSSNRSYMLWALMDSTFPLIALRRTEGSPLYVPSAATDQTRRPYISRISTTTCSPASTNSTNMYLVHAVAQICHPMMHSPDT